MNKRIKPGTTCYMCDCIAITMEHVPPKSFFPKTSDGKFKRELMKVPSCLAHNNDTSETDDLVSLLLHFAINGEMNEPARLQRDKFFNFNSENANNKISNIKKILQDDWRIEKLESRFADKEGETAVFKYSKLREHIGSTFIKISCGVYYKSKSEKVVGEHNVIDFIGVSTDVAFNLTRIRIKQNVNAELERLKVDFNGSNPEVFKYRYYENENSIFFHFVLYENIEIINQVKKPKVFVLGMN